MTAVGEDTQLEPHSIEAEQAALGSTMLSPGALTDVLGATQSGDYYRPAHQIVHEAIDRLHGQGLPVDAVTVAEELRRRGQLDRIGGALQLHTLIAAVPVAASAGYYASIVHGFAVQRRRQQAADQLAQLVRLPDPDPARLAELAARAAEPDADQHGAPVARRTWKPVNLDAVLDGTSQPPAPSVGTREDGRGLFYPGRLHVVAAESEAGKTWFALAAAAEELTFGRACVYLDFEDDETGIVGRLMSMGVSSDKIRDRFAYIKPEEAVGTGVNRRDLAEAVGDLRPSLAILDGVTEAMSLHGLELKDNTDVASFGRMLPRWIAESGAAVVTLDHVVKDREARSGGYAIGGVHKLNGLNGAMYLMENRDPFGVGLTGRSRILIRKDRPAQLRRYGVKVHDGLFWYADLVVESHHEDFAEVTLPPPAAQDSGEAAFRPTVIMGRICAALAPVPGGLSKNAIEGAVTGKATAVRYGLELLVSEGYVAEEKVGAAKLHKLVRSFPDE